MASVFTAHISERHRNILIVHLAIFILMMLVSTFLTHAFIRFLRKSLMGFNPHELLNMYIRQDDVMNSIEEGLIATDTDGKILFSNIVARNLFSDGPGEGPPLMAGISVSYILTPNSTLSSTPVNQSGARHAP